MEDFCLDFLKYQENPAGFTVPNHYHACYELVYYLSGTGEYSLDGHRYSYSSHTFALIPPRMVHTERTFDNSQLIFIGFRYFDVDIALHPRSYADFDDNSVYNALRSMEKELTEKRPLYSFMLNAMTQQLIISIARKYIGANGSPHDQGVQYIRKYIDEHFKERIGLRELADMSGYSYDWFRHVFKEQTGHSLTQYIILQRLRHAASQLVTTTKSVTQIAFENNFASSSQFIDQFKRRNGMTPVEYRKSSSDKNLVGFKDI